VLAGHHHPRQLGFPAEDGAEELGAGPVRQPLVEQDQIEGVGVDLLQGLGAGHDPLHGEAVVLEVEDEHLVQGDDEQPGSHALLPPRKKGLLN
jgi:hypothetical protein